jgi:hypothetical protein
MLINLGPGRPAGKNEKRKNPKYRFSTWGCMVEGYYHIVL